MSTSSLLFMASFFSPDAFAAEPEPLEPGDVQLELSLTDGSEAAMQLSGVEPCRWQRVSLVDRQGERWNIGLRAEPGDEGILLEADVRRDGGKREVEVRPTLRVAPQQLGEFEIGDGKLGLTLKLRSGDFPVRGPACDPED